MNQRKSFKKCLVTYKTLQNFPDFQIGTLPTNHPKNTLYTARATILNETLKCTRGLKKPDSHALMTSWSPFLMAWSWFDHHVFHDFFKFWKRAVLSKCSQLFDLMFPLYGNFDWPWTQLRLQIAVSVMLHNNNLKIFESFLHRASPFSTIVFK